jgi:hypothetical protein
MNKEAAAMTPSDDNVVNELRAIRNELRRLSENQMFTNRAVKALPEEFMRALTSVRDDVDKKPAAMSRTKRVVMNLLLMIVFCAGIVFLFWAIRPASAEEELSVEETVATNVATVLITAQECKFKFIPEVNAEVHEYTKNNDNRSWALEKMAEFDKKRLEVGTEQFCILAYSYVGDWLQRSDWTQGWGSGGALPDGKPHAVPLMGWRNEEE